MHTTFHLVTQGCKVNQYETQALREAWLGAGHAEVETPEAAAVVVINSCAVTARAVTDLRQLVGRVHRAAQAARIIVTGCAAQVVCDTLATLPGVHAIVPQASKDALVHYTLCDDATLPQGTVLPERGSVPQTVRHTVAAGETPHFPDLRISGFSRARPVVKVQDGCSHRCTYCIVPLARGRSRSRQPDEVVAEARALLTSGYRELIISGVNLRQYGADLPHTPDFWALLQHLERALAPEWAGRARLRLSSLEPGQLHERALDVLGNSRLVCPSLHISLQSGSHPVLQRMGRSHYRVDGLARFLEGLAAHWPLFGLGADVLVGFPGETEAEFAETVAYLRSLPFSYAHVFPYSRRPGTVAATMKNQLPREVKKARATLLRAEVATWKVRFAATLLARPQLSLVLDGHGGRKGVCEYYAECRLRSLPATVNRREVLAVTPVALEGETVLVDLVPSRG